MIHYGIVSEVTVGFAKVFLEEDNFPTDWLPILVRKSRTDKESWPLEINEHVVCLMDEKCETGVIIGAIPNVIDLPDPGEETGKFRKLFSDGTLLEFDKKTGKFLIQVNGELETKTTGKIVIDASGNVEVKTSGNAIIEANKVIAKGLTSVEIEAPNVTLKGNVSIQGSLTTTGGIAGASISTTGGGAIVASGNMTVQGTINATGDLTAGGKSLLNHVHTGVQTGGGITGPPQ